MQQEFEPKLPRDILEMSRNKSFNIRARFGPICTASKTKKYLLKNSTIGNRRLLSELENIEFTSPENSNWWLALLPDSNLFLKFQNNFTPEFWATFSYGLLLQRFFWNSSGMLIISIKADTGNFSKKYRQLFLLDAIFFKQKGPHHQWNRNISYYCRTISAVLCKVSQPSRWKRKSYDGKFVTAKCSNISDGSATLIFIRSTIPMISWDFLTRWNAIKVRKGMEIFHIFE